jgi:hypothetical protein
MFEMLLLALVMDGSGGPAPVDLRLEWVGGSAAVSAAAGETVTVNYKLRNGGESDAFAVVLRAVGSLGPLGNPVRLHPGPKAGQLMERRLSFNAAAGLREVCVDATLQNLNRDDPADPTPSNNRICRAVEVKEKER